MKSKLGLFAAMAMMGSGYAQNSNSIQPKDIDTTPIPKGCKEYFFNKEGEFYNGVDGRPPILKTDVVFSCVASSNKSAIKKFNKFITKNKTIQL
jgi:hypothetical protein